MHRFVNKSHHVTWWSRCRLLPSATAMGMSSVYAVNKLDHQLSSAPLWREAKIFYSDELFLFHARKERKKKAQLSHLMYAKAFIIMCTHFFINFFYTSTGDSEGAWPLMITVRLTASPRGVSKSCSFDSMPPLKEKW